MILSYVYMVPGLTPGKYLPYHEQCLTEGLMADAKRVTAPKGRHTCAGCTWPI